MDKKIPTTTRVFTGAVLFCAKSRVHSYNEEYFMITIDEYGCLIMLPTATKNTLMKVTPNKSLVLKFEDDRTEAVQNKANEIIKKVREGLRRTISI